MAEGDGAYSFVVRTRIDNTKVSHSNGRLGIIKLFVKGRIMVDPELMRRINPNYRMPAVEAFDDVTWEMLQDERIREGAITGADLRVDELVPEDLLVCSPTVQGFSLGDKQWLEFAVANIKDIDWNGDVLTQLSLPAKQMKVIHALCDAHLVRHYEFDDSIAGKGCGFSILLHGPPGVGKTMTAEAMSEHLQRPLYSISAGEPGIVARALEARLSDIFAMAERWHALLLLDEADVYVEQRAPKDLVRNELVCVFLRKLEYYRGILILTTNRITTIDEAVASRIHLPLPHHELSQLARSAIWKGFVHRVRTRKGHAECKSADIETLSRNVLNGRE
ncbi:hypothetical protein B0A54_16577 [Friedmanniomyces endolithicus]|uniref:AAA+ ATPase domain-containing protein n=1 Tax=Friedmanniomyces endolithicus TaxID=329885 RepID=A0A4U0U9P8_9PEZI|nr:hypothetical protein B0A54_16577 [Friedmanniomyces endolithicus]